MTTRDPRERILEAARKMAALGLVSGASGNVSVRAPGGFWITPSGLEYDVCLPDDVVRIAADGSRLEGRRAPSVETPMHLAAYRASPEIGAVVHSHPVHVTALAMLGWDLPPVLDSLAGQFGGPVPILPYQPSASAALAAQVEAAIARHPALILQNHGLVVGAAGLDQALSLTVLVERSAEAYLLARSAGEVRVLPDETVRERHIFVRTRYGQREGGVP